MASFTEEEIDQHALDWEVLRHGGIHLYLRPELMEEDLDWLRTREYKIHIFESGSWHSEASMHNELSSLLDFPAYYGRNLNALNDCMSEDLAVPDVGGVVLSLRHFDQFAIRSESAHALLDILAKASRQHMLRGRRLLVFLQSNDPRIIFTGLGGITAHWNRREWLSKDRGL